MPIHRSRPSWEILSGDSADVYFARAERILEREGLDPVVTMEVFTRPEALRSDPSIASVVGDPVGRLGRRLLRSRRADPRARGPGPGRDDGGLHPPGGP